MATIRQEYQQYLNDNFNGQKINKPLFLNGNFGLRFDLQVGETDTGEYFAEVIRRSTSLFESVFDPTDNLFIVFRDYKWKRRKIRFSNYCFKQIADLKTPEIDYLKVKHLYENNSDDIYNVALLKLEVNRINYKNILTAIANTDFPPRLPRFKFLSSAEIYFINIDKNLIFNMYDDRGLDIIASEASTLQPLYKKFNDWILEANREKIDGIMSIF